jgi:hypothetical protein
LGPAPQKQADTETNRTQNAGTEMNEAFHQLAFGSAVQVSAGTSGTPG